MDGDVFVFDSVKEEVFWRNYFYRVSLIKQSAQLTALAAQQQQKDGEDRGAGVSPEDVVLTGQTPICALTTTEMLCMVISPVTSTGSHCICFSFDNIFLYRNAPHKGQRYQICFTQFSLCLKWLVLQH